MAAGSVSKLEAAPARARERALGLAVALAVIVFNAAWVAASLGPLHKPRRVLETDHWHYIEMARAFAGSPDHDAGVRPELARRAPFCFRVLVPALAGALMRAGVSLHAAYYLVTNLSLLGWLYVLFVSLEELGFARRPRLVALVLVGLMPGAVRWFEYQYWMTDPTALLLIALGVRLARRERWLPLGLTALVAAFAREQFVLLPVFAFGVRLRRAGWLRALRDAAALAAGPLAASLALRHAIVPAIRPDWAESLRDILAFRLNHLFDNQLYVLTLGTWGVLLPLALLAPRARDARRRPAEWLLLAGVYAGTLLFANNTDRLLVYALPVVLPPALLGLERLIDASRAPALVVVGGVVALQALLYVETPFTGLGISVYQPVSPPVVATLLVFGLVAACVVRCSAQSRSQSQMA